jgi:hypothetical protein
VLWRGSDGARPSMETLSANMPTYLIRRIVVIGLATWFAWAVHAQPAPTEQPPPNAVSVEQSATFDVTAVSGSLKETVQKEQQLVWLARRTPNERRFQLTDMSVALLRNQATGGVKITFAGDVSAFGASRWRAKTQCRRAHTGRRIDLFVDFCRFRAVRRQQPAIAIG